MKELCTDCTKAGAHGLVKHLHEQLCTDINEGDAEEVVKLLAMAMLSWASLYMSQPAASMHHMQVFAILCLI